MRLHTKFLALVLGSLVLFLGLLSIIIVEREALLLKKKAEHEQHFLSFTIYSDLRNHMLKGTPRSTLKLMEDLRGRHGLMKLEALRKDGYPAFGVRGKRFAGPQLGQVFESGQELSFGEELDPPLRTILYPLRNDPECRTCHRGQEAILGVLHISLSLEDSRREIAANTGRLALFLGALITVTGGVLYVLVRKFVLQPLEILHAGAERIGRGDLKHRISLATGDEIQVLAGSFNAMAKRLEESHAGLEQKVRERTAEVRDKATRLYEFSRDMATISRLSTKVFNAEQPLDTMLDRFLWAISHGLGYRRSILCLVDRKHALLEVKRDAGLGEILGITRQPLSGPDPFAALVRSGRELYVRDVAQDPVFSRCCRQGGVPELKGLLVVPIRSGTQDRLCREAKSCTRTDCPAYQNEEEKCWLVQNTLCGDPLMESYGDKLAYCMSCEVFPVLGVLIVAAREDRQLRRRDISVLRIVAAEMGAALENHRLHEDNRQLLAALLGLHTVTATAVAGLSPDAALAAFADSAMRFSGFDACSFWILSPDGRELVRKAARFPAAADESFCPRSLPADRGVLAAAISRNEAAAEYTLPLQDPAGLGGSRMAGEFPALLAVPLKTGQRAIGAFCLHKKSRTPFFEREIAAFKLLANHAAMTVNVCRLNEELKIQNRELASKSNLMGGILQNMSSGVMLLDNSGTIRLINQAGAMLLLFAPEEMLHRRLLDLIPDAEHFVTAAPGAYHETELRRGDGGSLSIGFSIALFTGQGGAPEGTIVIYRDLTEIKSLQAAVLSKERFATMGRVVAGVAHEIRNPLFGISSIGQIFERELNNPAHLDLVKALLSETGRLNHLVEELLIYGRPIPLSLAACDLRQLWEEVAAMHREELTTKGIAFEGDLERGHTRAVLDAHQIRQVFLNLLRNAIEATPRDGKITVRLLLEDRYIIFRITDTGTGIAAQNISRVFDLFFTTKSKGTGLGLAICRKIIEDHGGGIALESREQEGPDGPRGTTVTVRLPHRGTMEKLRKAADNMVHGAD